MTFTITATESFSVSESVHDFYVEGILNFEPSENFMRGANDISDTVEASAENDMIKLTFLYEPIAYYGEGIDIYNPGDHPNLGSGSSEMEGGLIFILAEGEKLDEIAQKDYDDITKWAETKFKKTLIINGSSYTVEGYFNQD
jgi:hypothetical protein